ncbi:MAG TPA: ABC transporter permease subunit [Lachnospiraceae bacterium]|nr:ABC transporter permease subunit [Lachnospiraceae bacterium]
MNSYIAFLRKEFCEVSRTYKLLIMGAVFLLFGLMSPIFAKLTPQILENFMPKGIHIEIAEPTAIDSWAQFFKNISQMGLIVLVVVFSGSMANELSRGTLINVLTKGLPRRTVILSKYTMMSIIWTLCYFGAFLVSYGYTVYFWNNEGVRNLLFSVLMLWIFGLLLLAVSLLGGVLFRNIYGSLLFTGSFVMLEFVTDIIPKWKEINPIRLTTDNMTLLTKAMSINDFVVPIILAVILIVASMIASILVFNRKQV